MSQRKKRNIEDITWIVLDMPNGSQEQACSVGDAAPYLDINDAAVTNILDKNKIKRWKRGYGSTKFVLKKDLDELKRVRPAE